MLKTAVIMVSESDMPKLEPCFEILEKFEMPFETRILSAQRTSAAAEDFVSQARSQGFGVIIAVDNKAAHLGGLLAAYTTLPVIGLPIKESLEGIDALLSMVQIPAGIPVATVAIDGAANAAILAAQIIATGDTELLLKLELFRRQMTDEVIEKDRKMQLKQ